MSELQAGNEPSHPPTPGMTYQRFWREVPVVGMMIHLDPDACTFGWGPCTDAILKVSHCCKKREGHVGYHICDWCGHRKRTYRQVLIDAKPLKDQVGESER